MSNSSDQLNQAPAHRELSAQQTISLLEKALQRERNQKKQLEAKLDQQAQASFLTNKEMLDAFEQSNKRQVQLQFLAFLTKDMLSDHSIDEMFSDFIVHLSQMLENCGALQLVMASNQNYQVLKKPPNTNEWQTIPWQSQFSGTIEYLNNKESNHLWQRVEHEQDTYLTCLSALLDHTTLLHLTVPISNEEQRIIVLDVNHYCYNEDFKQTLHIAGQQFRSAIKRRYTEIELAYNYQTLTSTLTELKDTQQQLVHNEKMASLGQLAAGVAHEINNPIGYINSNLDTLKDYIALFNSGLAAVDQEQLSNTVDLRQLNFAQEDVIPLIDACLEGITRVTDIVNGLKTFSRKDHSEFVAVNINEVIENALKVVWNKLKYQHQVVKKLAEPLPDIVGNFGQLQQVFINLFVNAENAMFEKGTLTVESKLAGNEVEVSVSDTGCGMSETTLKQLFEPFYTTKAENEGTGLGLSVSYAIIEQHNAIISVNSELNHGSVFTIRFPLESSVAQ